MMSEMTPVVDFGRYVVCCRRIEFVVEKIKESIAEVKNGNELRLSVKSIQREPGPGDGMCQYQRCELVGR